MKKKVITINNYFYNTESLDYVKNYIDNTLKHLKEIYNELGGLENENFTDEQMIALYNFIDLLRDYDIKEIDKNE